MTRIGRIRLYSRLLPNGHGTASCQTCDETADTEDQREAAKWARDHKRSCPDHDVWVQEHRTYRLTLH